MKMHPPALINKRVTEDMFHWVRSQPSVTTIAIPNGVEVPKDISIVEMMDMLGEWRKSDKSLKLTTTSPSTQDYPIDDRTKEFILFELQKILDFNGYRSELLANGSLMISKDYWQMTIEKIYDHLPFPDHLPYHIDQTYKHQHKYNLHTSETVKIPRYDCSDVRLHSIRQTIIDNTNGEL